MDKRKDIEDDRQASQFLPTIEPENWEGLDSVEIDEETQVLENGDLRYENDNAAESLDEDDDNAYQESDEALPDDDEEAVISSHPDKSRD